MTLELVPVESQHISEIGRICFEAFRHIHDKHAVTSLSLYSLLGFDVKETVVLMQTVPAFGTDGTVRLVTEADLPTIEELSKRIYKVSRRNEITAAIAYGFSPFLIERAGQISGYLIPGFFDPGVWYREI